MKHLPCIWITFLLIMIALGAGCTQPATPPVTPTPTVPPTTSTPVPTTMAEPTASPVSLIPGPTVTLPPEYDVFINLNVDSISRTIAVEYRGGTAGYYLQRIQITITTPQKEIITREFLRERPNVSIPAGSEVVIQTIKGIHRFEVSATINGVTYKIRDDLIQV